MQAKETNHLWAEPSASPLVRVLFLPSRPILHSAPKQAPNHKGKLQVGCCCPLPQTLTFFSHSLELASLTTSLSTPRIIANDPASAVMVQTHYIRFDFEKLSQTGLKQGSG